MRKDINKMSYQAQNSYEKQAVNIVDKLQKAGFQAFFVGGFVRDLILGERSADIDIATSAKPDEVSELFDNIIEVGKQFGVVMVLLNGHQYEIATFRSEEKYTDGRRPETVDLTSDMRADAGRRDFTFNAMYLDPINGRLYDFFQGEKDLKKRKLRFVGDYPDIDDNQAKVAYQRIVEEDYLRILRAVRFAARFKMAIESGVAEIISENAHLLKKVSPERIQNELRYMFSGSYRQAALILLDKMNCLVEILPEIVATKDVDQPEMYHSEGDVWTHTKLCFGSLNRVFDEENNGRIDEEVIWATLLHDIGKVQTYYEAEDRIRFNNHDNVGAEIARQILERLHFSRRFIESVHWLVKYHMIGLHFAEMRTVKQKRYALHEMMPRLLMVFKADLYGTKPQRLDFFREVKDIYDQVKKQGIAEQKKQAAGLLSGNEIKEILSVSSGNPLVGMIKELVIDGFLQGELKTRVQAKTWVRENLAELRQDYQKHDSDYWRKVGNRQGFMYKWSRKLWS